MFENFAFSHKADSDSSPDDDDPPPSPKSKSDEGSSPMPAPVQQNAEGDHLDCLVRKMSKQTFIRDQQRTQPTPTTLSLSLEPQSCDSELALTASQAPPIQIVQTSPHAAKSSIEDDPNRPAQPIVDDHPAQLQSQVNYESIENQSNSPITEDASHLKVPDWSGFRRQTEKRHRSTSPNPRTLDLLANMVETGAQCNVHASGPSTPLTPIRPSSLTPIPTNSAPPPRLDHNINPQMVDEDKMDLEIDMDFCAEEGEAAPSEGLTLRDAGAPAGVRKFGFLKYRSSLEAASRCKNMRKSVPRMRRRAKSQHADSETSSNSAAL
ncbi:hypothetical protein F4677DRAFT_342974 [Hypoxylon crocopeplum]|nr:hypothetical protein F4677DRAFT_342974 [Hypoxylon crocopeplum]